jgi:putative ABC transport system permease protein
MSLPAGVRRLLRLGDPARDVADELSHHFEHAVAELESRGMSPSEARQEAEHRFGNVAAYRRELERLDEGGMRRRRRTHRVGAAGDVVRHATRALLRAPALSFAIVLTLALGIGANVTMYGIIDRLLLSPPAHVAAPEHVHRVMIEQYEEWRGERRAAEHMAWLDFQDMAAARGLEAAAAWQETRLTVGHGMEARQLDGMAVSGGYFALRGATAALGRLLTEEDDRRDAERAAVISYDMWQRDYGGSSDVLGQSLSFGQAPYTIVGVAPRAMPTLRLQTVDVWLPLQQAVGEDILTTRNWHAFSGVVRVGEGVSAAAAMAEMSLLLRQGRAEQIAAGRFDANARALLTPLLEARGPLARPEVAVAKWLGAVSLIVLLIACVNVANLLLARAVRQRREIAVRLALGISRRRLVGQFLIEGVALGLAGGALALLLTRWLGPLAGALLLPDIAWQELGAPRLLLPLTLGVAALAGLLAAVMPAAQMSKPALADTLRQAATGGRESARTRTALSLAQAALSVVLLVGAGLFVRSLVAVQAVDLGYDMDGLLYVEASFTPGSTTPEERLRLRHELLERLRAHPAMTATTAANTAPFLWVMSNNVRLPGRDSLPRIGSGDHWIYIVAPDYFEMLGVQLVRGRTFTAADASTGANVAVIGETMAAGLWPDTDPLGACMYIDSETDECTFVVGIVRDTKQQHVREEGSAQYYLPLTAEHNPAVMIVRPRPGLERPADAIRSAITQVDSRVRFVTVTPAADRFAPQVRTWRMGAVLFTGFGVLALVIATLGLYAVLAFDVSQRTREIGVRSALGAGRRDILRLILGSAVRVAAAGIAIGGVIAALLAPRLADTLFEVGPRDAVTYAAVAATLLLVAVAAALLPARRATAVDPNQALRAE